MRSRPLELDALDVPEHPEHGVDALGQQRRDEVEADVDRLDLVGVGAGGLEDRRQVGVLVGDAGGADLLALQLGRLADGLLADGDDRRQRLLHERPDRDDLDALRAGEQQLGLVGDRQVGLAGGQQLQRRRRVRRRARRDVELRRLELAGVDRRVDAGVVGVGQVVQDEVDALRRAAAGRLLLLAAGGEPGRAEGGEQRRCRRQGDGRFTGRFLSVDEPMEAGGARRARAARTARRRRRTG